jgi:hypothetical protein
MQEIRAALEGHSREELAEILTFVFREYVVESPLPPRSAAPLLDTRTELEGLSFAELVTWLQTHLDVLELSQLEVSGERVLVRVGGRAQPIDPPAARPEPVGTAPPAGTAPPSSASPSATSSPTPSPPVREVVARNPAPTSAPAAPASAPAAPAGQASAPAGQPKPDEPAPEPSSRFSLLEVD